MHTDLTVLFFKELLLDYQLRELLMLLLCFLLLFTAANELTKFILCGEASQGFLPAKLSHFCLQFVLVDVKLL